jgi:hypothetical protein
VARLRAEEAEPVILVVGADDALADGALGPRRHLSPCAPAARTLARHMRGLLPRIRVLFLFVVDGVVGVIQLVKGDAFLPPEDLGPHLAARP